MKQVIEITNYSSYLCGFQDDKKEGPIWEELTTGEKNVVYVPYSEKKSFPSSSYQIRFDEMETINKEDYCCKYICGALIGSGIEKLKARIFNGSDIKKHTRDETFVRHITVVESNAWWSFVEVMKNLLGNKRLDDYMDRVVNMLKDY